MGNIIEKYELSDGHIITRSQLTKENRKEINKKWLGKKYSDFREFLMQCTPDGETSELLTQRNGEVIFMKSPNFDVEHFV